MTERRSDVDADTLRESTGLYRTRVDRATALPPESRIKAKLFYNGRSQAVRLPKAFRLPGTEVHVSKEGKRVILEPIETPPRDNNGWPVELWSRLAELRCQLTDEDFALPPDPPPPPDDCGTTFELGEAV